MLSRCRCFLKYRRKDNQKWVMEQDTNRFLRKKTEVSSYCFRREGGRTGWRNGYSDLQLSLKTPNIVAHLCLRAGLPQTSA